MRRWRSIVAGNRRAILAAMFALIRLWHHAILAAGGLMDRTVDRGDGLRTGGNSSCTECIADVRQTAAGRSVRAAPGQRQAAHPEPDGRSRPHYGPIMPVLACHRATGPIRQENSLRPRHRSWSQGTANLVVTPCHCAERPPTRPSVFPAARFRWAWPWADTR
jgi:hypothetical protein